jgi:hypothetical protein
MQIEFEAFPKVPRLSRECVITEKLDGTNSQVIVLTEQPSNVAFFPVTYNGDSYYLCAGSRNRFLDTSKTGDNYGFAKWVEANCAELVKLGPGRHYGEWWGQGIQRNYGLREKRFSLFNVGRWTEENKPACCHLVPIIYRGEFSTSYTAMSMGRLNDEGSIAAPGFMDPEGIMIYHTAADQMFKKTFEKDNEGKGT